MRVYCGCVFCLIELREQVKQEVRLTPPRLPRITSTGFRQQRSGSFTSLEVEFSCLRAELITSLEDDEKSLSMMRNALRDWEAKQSLRRSFLARSRMHAQWKNSLSPWNQRASIAPCFISLSGPKGTLPPKRSWKNTCS